MALQPEVIPNSFTLSLPQELVECATSFSERPEAVSQLEDALLKLASRSAKVEASLREIQQMIKEEQLKESEFQVLAGSRPISLMYEMERETLKYSHVHSMALDAKNMQFHVTHLKLLAKLIVEINSNVPSFMELDTKTQDSLEDMKRIMAKVGEMKSQRAQLEEKLKRGVTESLVRNCDVAQGMTFEQEMKKHDEIVQLIRQNIQAQWFIFRAMAEKDGVYAEAKLKVMELMKKRENVIKSMLASYHAYEGLMNETTKNLEFYENLDVNMSKFKARLREVMEMQEKERAQQMTSLAHQNKVLTMPDVELGEVEITINADNSFVTCESDISLLDLSPLDEVEDCEPQAKKMKIEEDNLEDKNGIGGDHTYAALKDGVETKASGGTEYPWSSASPSYALEAGLVFSSRADVRMFIAGYSRQAKSKFVVSAGGASDGCSSRQVN